MLRRPLDTDEASWFTQRAVVAGMGGPNRLLVAVELSDVVREIRLAGIRARQPGLTHPQVVRHLVSEDYGVELPRRP